MKSGEKLYLSSPACRGGTQTPLGLLVEGSWAEGCRETQPAQGGFGGGWGWGGAPMLSPVCAKDIELDEQE